MDQIIPGTLLIAALAVSAGDPIRPEGGVSPELPLNFIEYDAHLASAGQPTEDQFRLLHQRGYELIVNIAPPTASRSLPNEGYLVASTGMTYVNIPVDWERPKLRDFEIFAGVLNANPQLKTLVHCQVNMRATAFSYLYRVIYLGADPADALSAMQRIWIPNETWTELGRAILAEHGREADLWIVPADDP